MNRPDPPSTPRLTPSAWVRCVDTRPESGEGCMLAEGHSGAHESATRAWHNRALEPAPVVIDRFFEEPRPFEWTRPRTPSERSEDGRARRGEPDWTAARGRGRVHPIGSERP